MVAQFTEPDNDPRPRPPTKGDELATLLGFLRWYRESLPLKTAGLDADALARRAVEPSTLSLLGLIRHLADVEHGWFRRVLAAQDVPWVFRTVEDSDAAFNGAVADPAEVERAWAAWRDAIAFADAYIAGAPDLDATGEHPLFGTVSTRWVLLHMIEEYARHLGHVDLLRERIDGRVGM